MLLQVPESELRERRHLRIQEKMGRFCFFDQLFGGGGRKKQKITQKVELPPHIVALQTYLIRALIARMFQDRGYPQLFDRFLSQGPRPFPHVIPSGEEQKQLGFGPDPQLSPALQQLIFGPGGVGFGGGGPGGGPG